MLMKGESVKRKRFPLVFLGALLLGLVQPAFSQSVLSTGVKATHHEVPLNKSYVFSLSQPASKISVGNPEVADILLLSRRQLYVVGKSLGTTNVVLWDREKSGVAVMNIEVVHDLETLKAKLHEILPHERIAVYSSQGAIVLNGEVSSLGKMDAALNLARSFLPQQKGKEGGAEGDEGLINLMNVGGAQQVMLEVKVAEIARSVLKRLKIDFHAFNPSSRWSVGAVNGGARFPNFVNQDGLELPLTFKGNPVGPNLDLFEPNTPTISAAGLFFSYLSGGFLMNATIDAAKNNNLVKILAEPTLTAQTGQEAAFLSGGEFPIPVPQGGLSNAITVKFKEFGIGLKFLPVVLDSGHINLKTAVSVSELSSDAALFIDVAGSSSRFSIPSLTTRKASTTLELSDGQTMGIAGLISDNLRENVDKLPGLGDIPVLGALFRSQNFRKDQTELVIFVTPHLARPIAPQQVRLPTDAFVEPSDLEFYLMGRLEARPAPVKGVTYPGQSQQEFEGGMEGSFGQQVQ